ncbi:MAG: hypothetical protein GY842_15855 [bacterium]|nr:hypothetical protein [bacterium]
MSARSRESRTGKSTPSTAPEPSTELPKGQERQPAALAPRHTSIALGMLGLVILVGLSLRFYGLDHESLWLDEGKSVGVASLPLGTVLQKVYETGTNPPLHYVMLHFWIKAFGDSESSVRALSAVCSVASILILYSIGVALAGRAPATLAIVLLSLSSFHIHFAQEARAYALFGMFSLLSMYFLLKAEGNYSVFNASGYIVASALVLYSHPHGLFVIVTQNIYILPGLLRSARTGALHWRRWALMQGLTCLAFSPWLGVLATKALYIQSHRLWYPRPSALGLLSAIGTLCGHSKVISCLFMVLAAAAVVTVRREPESPTGRSSHESVGKSRWRLSIRHSRSVYFLCVWFLAPVLIPFLISQVSAPIFNWRYFIVASFSLYLLVSIAVIQMRPRYMQVIILAVVILWYPVRTIEHYKEVNKAQWRSVANMLKAQAGPDDIVVVSADFCLNYILPYYMRGSGIRQIGFSRGANEEEQEDFSGEVEAERLAGLLEQTKDHERVWLVLGHIKANQAGRIIGKLQEAYRVKGRHEFYKVQLLLFER